MDISNSNERITHCSTATKTLKSVREELEAAGKRLDDRIRELEDELNDATRARDGIKEALVSGAARAEVTPPSVPDMEKQERIHAHPVSENSRLHDQNY